MGFPVTATLTLEYPPDEGLPPDNLPFPATMTVENRSVQRLKLVGAGTKKVDFGTIGEAGAKLILVVVEQSTGAAPITCRYNGGGALGEVEVSPGGYTCIVSPTPANGIVSLDILYTTNVNVRVWLFG
jgi:hypothetical protein